jgi:hypothetical protein
MASRSNYSTVTTESENITEERNRGKILLALNS